MASLVPYGYMALEAMLQLLLSLRAFKEHKLLKLLKEEHLLFKFQRGRLCSDQQTLEDLWGLENSEIMWTLIYYYKPVVSSKISC